MRTENIKRYFWLLDTIYRSSDVGITFEEINENWERNDLLSGGQNYPKRTFESHRQNIEKVFGILIDCDRRTNRYFISDREELKNQNHILKWLVETFNLNDVVAIENLGRITYFVCGLAFEERNDIAKGTVFIVS